MKLRFTPRAAEHIAAIADYIRTRNPREVLMSTEVGQEINEIVFELIG
jgi:hypothetical protein